MTSSPDFGKRKPVQPPAPDPEAQKRSRNVVLLLMGTVAVGSIAYTMMSGENCDPTRPTVPGEKYECPQKASSSGGGHSYGGSSHSSFFSSSSSSSGGGDASSGTHVSRGGFGSFMSHFSGGG